MLTTRLIACLDVADGRVVKGTSFADLRDCGDPAALAARYEADGADEIAVLDVRATLEGRSARRAAVERVRAAVGLPLTVGGGVTSIDAAAALFDAGADRVVVNSAALRRPELLTHLADRYGAQAAVLAVDARRQGQGGYEAVVRAGSRATGLDAVSWAAEGARRGAGEILLTSIDRDGTGTGYDLDLIRRVVAATGRPVIASGGAGTALDLLAALEAGADALLVAGILHRRETTIRDLKRALAARGKAIRPC